MPTYQLPTTTDPRCNPEERADFVDELAVKLIKDPRDRIFVRVQLGILLSSFPLALLLFVPGVFSWYLVPVYYATILYWMPRYILMLHAVLHRPIFPRERGWMNNIVSWVIGPLFGQTPTSVFVHHIGMHHVEDNQREDLSTTIYYQRDSFLHWLHYWARFYFVGTLHLYQYLVRTKRKKLAKSLVVGELSWLALTVLMSLVNWQATLVVLVIPLLFIRVMFMTGNWGQHAFVDVDDPTNAYKHSTCLINVPYNHRCYNDGYHIVHHLHGNMHWSEMPDHFHKNIDEYVKNDAIVFSGLGNNQTVWWCLMTGQYERLAEYVVPFQGRSKAETVAWLKSRTQRRLGTIKGIFEFEGTTPR